MTLLLLSLAPRPSRFLTTLTSTRKIFGQGLDPHRSRHRLRSHRLLGRRPILLPRRTRPFPQLLVPPSHRPHRNHRIRLVSPAKNGKSPTPSQTSPFTHTHTHTHTYIHARARAFLHNSIHASSSIYLTKPNPTTSTRRTSPSR